MPQPASRLITLMMLLQRQPNQKAAALAKTLGVSVRTLHRYVSALDEMGIPVYSEHGPHGGFSLVRGYRLPPLIFSPEEAAALYLGTSLVEEIWGGLYRDAATSALAKIDNVLPGDQQREVTWARRSIVASGMRHAVLEAAAPILDSLRRAIKEQKTIRMTYRPGSQMVGGETLTREVDPYALAHRWTWWYVIGFCHLRGELRSFRVDRILDLSLTAKSFTTPAEFDAQEYLNEMFHLESKVTIAMRFQPEAAQTARANQFSWDHMEEKEDGSIDVAFSVPDLDWAASTVLGYGPIVRVLEPPELVARIKDWLHAIGEFYPR